ncbi:hypothetical protein [Paenibacillus oryzisoli]|uniref:Uncharacterized protein n=1 Tax=Paenibacillus oryzisoli TaxID=1850517 RepID=A0A198A2G0_9BACL|nr:hypothetical protein [Paenibacillus oryzisoli]OAS15654.1 hypothetical protein A8708_03460 [Paenibacillus oryzisoli]
MLLTVTIELRFAVNTYSFHSNVSAFNSRSRQLLLVISFMNHSSNRSQQSRSASSFTHQDPQLTQV